MFIGMFLLITFSSNKHCMLVDTVYAKGIGGECSNRKEAASSTSNPYHPGSSRYGLCIVNFR